MYYLYLDESGDLGDHIQSPDASRHFVIAVLEVLYDKNMKAIAKAVERTIKNKLRKKHSRKAKPIAELKGTTTDLADKKYFYRHLAAIPFTISAVILEKERFVNHSFSHEDKLLQAVDLFAWGIYRKYEVGDTRWYEIFKEKVVFERVYPDK